MIALKLKNMIVQHANFLPVLQIAGFPAITSFTGFANAIAFKYGLNNSQVLIISNGCEVEYGLKKYNTVNTNKVSGNNTYINSYSEKKLSLSDQPNVFGRMELSLYIYLEDSIGSQIKKDILSGELKHSLLTKFRVSGGVITKMDDISLIEEELIIEDILKNKKGYFICDEREKLVNTDITKDILEIALEKVNESKQNNRINKNSDEILSLTSIGYYLLEEPKIRDGVREDKRHSYAEPLIGLISFKKINLYNKQDVLPFWEMVKYENLFVAIN